MNLISRLLTGATLLAALPAAMAASTVDVTVSGSIVPAACTPSLSASDFNHGKTSKTDLNLDGPTVLDEAGKVATLSVNCTAATVYGIRGIDNRADTVGNNSYVTPYGLGLTPKGEKLGAHYLEIYPNESLIDGKPAFVSVGNSSGTAWRDASQGERGIRNYGELLGFTDTAGPLSQPKPIKDAAFSLKSYVVIAPAKGLTLTDEVALDGAATIEVVYL
jgi:hypothetical protein